MDKLTDIFLTAGVSAHSTINTLTRYAKIIHSENEKYNLTGHKTIEDIIQNLIIESLTPLNLADVPRGTSAADMGTGAGIPGIPLAVVYPDIEFTLFDSNSKKIRFIDYVSEELSLKNIKPRCGRIEELSREREYREKFDIVLSRAMSNVYTAAELCSPFIRPGGYFYLYISERQKNLPPPVKEHLKKLSLEFSSIEKPTLSLHIKTISGLLLEKKAPVADIYPRRISAIKRGSAEIEKNYL